MAMNSTQGLNSGGKAKYTFALNRFKGVDFTSNPMEINESRSPDMVNMIPGANGSLKCRNGYEKVIEAPGRINGIYSLKELSGEHIIIHHGNKLSEWREHDIVEYTVPNGGLKVSYCFKINGVVYSFFCPPIKDTDDVIFTLSTGKIRVNNTEITTMINGTESNSTKIIMEEGDVPGVYHTKRKVMIFNLLGMPGLSTYGLDGFMFDSPYNNKDVIYGYIGVEPGDIPETGLEVKFYDSSQVLKWTLSDGSTGWTFAKTQKSSAVQESWVANPNNLWTNDRGWSYEINNPTGAYYGFTVDNKMWFFGIPPLTQGDVFRFDCESKYAFLNGKRITIWAASETSAYQPLAVTVARSPLIELATVPDNKSSCQQINNNLYIFTGDGAYVYGGKMQTNDEGHATGDKLYSLSLLTDKAYTPLVKIGTPPITTTRISNGTSTDTFVSSGTALDKTNILSDKREQSFLVSCGAGGHPAATSYTGVGDVLYYKLALCISPINKVDRVQKLSDVGEWEDVATSDYSVNLTTGIITFVNTLYPTPVVGRDNYKVVFTVKYDGGSDLKAKVFAPQDAVKTAYDSVNNCNRDTYYIGKDIDNPADGIDVVIQFGSGRKANTTVYDTGGDTGYINDDTSGINSVSIGSTTIKAKINSPTHNIVLPSGEAAMVRFNAGNGMHYYTKYHIVGKLINDDGTYYLEISEPYYNATYAKEYMEERTRSGCLAVYSFELVLSYTEYSYKDRINKATICTKFGAAGNMDRLFVAGWDKMREYEFWSEVNDPTYFPDSNYARLGDEDTAVMGWSRINNNQLAIHKSDNGQDATIHVQSATLNNNNATALFPVKEGPVGAGVISSRAFSTLNGEPLALSGSGVFSVKYVEDVAADVRYAAPRSFFIDARLEEKGLADAESITYKGKYYLAVGGEVFIADGNQKAMIGGNKGYEFSYEWYYWNNIPCRVWWIHDDELYFGSNDGTIYRFNDGYYDDGKPVECYWCSKPMNFNHPTYYKKIKNMYVTVSPYEWSEVNVDYITDRVKKTVKNYSVHSYDSLPITIATNYKATKIEDIQFKIWAHNAEPLEMLGMSAIYTVGGKYKGV